MEEKIALYHEKIRKMREESTNQLFNLSVFFKSQFELLGQKIATKIDTFNASIEANISYYKKLEDDNPMKGYFRNMLFAQLSQEIGVMNFENSVGEDGELLIQPTQIVTNQQHQQLKEVHVILRKAMTLFSEQFSNSVLSQHNPANPFAQKNIDFENDFRFSQDRAHASLVDRRESRETDIRFSFQREIDFAGEWPGQIAQQLRTMQVKCFCMLEDNRRAVICTRDNLLLVDLVQVRILRFSELRGIVPSLPTCIQPLYSYEHISEDGAVSMSDDLSKLMLCPSASALDVFSVQVNANPTNGGGNYKRVRRQNLVAVGMGNLSQMIDICIFSLNTLQKILRLPGHNRTICKMVQPMLDYEILFSVSSDKKIFVWNLTQGVSLSVEGTQHNQSINDAIILNERELATFSLNGEIFLWDITYDQQTKKYAGIKKRLSIHRQCLSLYIGQVISSSERFFFSITSHGIVEQRYILEMNDYQSRIVAKEELPHKVVGLNVLVVNNFAYAIITYQTQNFLEIYRVNMIFTTFLSPVTLHQRITFPRPESQISNVIENPRVQFISSLTNRDKILILIALDDNILEFSVS